MPGPVADTPLSAEISAPPWWKGSCRDTGSDLVVAEISSFQLDISKNFVPDVAVLLNISEDHLDRYDDYKAYQDSKWSMFDRQTVMDTAIINADIPNFKGRTAGLLSDVLAFSARPENPVSSGISILDPFLDIQVPGIQQRVDASPFTALAGLHNQENLAAAILACIAAGMNLNGILDGVASFKGLSHRIEFVKTINEVSYYNDSKATNTDAAIKALQRFSSPVILILGGREKETNFSLLKSAVRDHVKSIIAIGESRNEIKKTFRKICPVASSDTMFDAVKKAHEQSVPNDVVLLSPACASFDMFDNYVHRGNEFMACVTQLEAH